MSRLDAIQRVKVHGVDCHAYAKGFRRNRTYWVVGRDADCNPQRGLLYVCVNRLGRVEGFFADQFRVTIRDEAAAIPGWLYSMAKPDWAASIKPMAYTASVYAKD